MKAHFILFVAAQEKSTAFYSSVLGEAPILNVPGMTEFRLGQEAILGLMPESVRSMTAHEERNFIRHGSDFFQAVPNHKTRTI